MLTICEQLNPFMDTHLVTVRKVMGERMATETAVPLSCLTCQSLAWPNQSTAIPFPFLIARRRLLTSLPFCSRTGIRVMAQK
jgi:hypothetical protein